jgi:hypothetical protein
MAVPLLVRDEQPAQQADELVEGDVFDWRPRRNPCQKATFALVDVPGSGEIALVEHRLSDRPLGVARQVAGRGGGVPVGTEQVRTEVADKGVLRGRRHQGDVVHAVPDRGGGLGREDDADVVAGRPDEHACGPNPPRAVHA